MTNLRQSKSVNWEKTCLCEYGFTSVSPSALQHVRVGLGFSLLLLNSFANSVVHVIHKPG
jgi:hypothetical protein